MGRELGWPPEESARAVQSYAARIDYLLKTREFAIIRSTFRITPPHSMLSAGIVGLPNVGKSTLFNAVTQTRKAMAANYRFCTIEPNQGIVTVPDERLAVLSGISGSHKLVPAIFEFVDIAGLVSGASTGAGLGKPVSGPHSRSGRHHSGGALL